MVKRIFGAIHHYFIPSENNNLRARILHIDILALFLVFAIGLSIFTTTEFGRNILGYAVDIKSVDIFTQINQVRENHGLKPLKESPELDKAAYAKANHMFANQYWAHFAQDGTSPWQFIIASGYQYTKAGENLGMGFSYTNDLVEKWMASPSHAANILEPEYEDMGIAIVNGNLLNDDITLVVQMFGKRLVSQNNQSPIENIAAKPNNLIAQAKEDITPTIIPAKNQAKENEIKQAVEKQTRQKTNTTVMTAAKDVNQKPYNIPFNISFTILILLSAALIIDFVYAYKLKIFRVTGKNIAHLFFIGIIIISIFFLTQGRIL